jgi:hypothetical protein
LKGALFRRRSKILREQHVRKVVHSALWDDKRYLMKDPDQAKAKIFYGPRLLATGTQSTQAAAGSADS